MPQKPSSVSPTARRYAALFFARLDGNPLMPRDTQCTVLADLFERAMRSAGRVASQGAAKPSSKWQGTRARSAKARASKGAS